MALTRTSRGLVVHAFRRDEVHDALLGLLLHPAVDPDASRLRGALEVEGLERGAVGGVHRVEVALLEPVALLAEQPVGDAKHDWPGRIP